MTARADGRGQRGASGRSGLVLAAFAAVLFTVAFVWGIAARGVGEVGFLSAFVAYPAAGAVIVRRSPRHRVGWLFLAIGLLVPTASIADTFRSTGSSVWHAWAAWLPNLAFPLLFGALTSGTLLLFPDGRLPSRRWRPVGLGTLFSVVVVTVAFAVRPGPIPCCAPHENPIGVAALDGPAWAISEAGMLVLALLMLVAAASVVARYRQATPLARAQLRWFLAGVAVFVFGAVAALLERPLGLDRWGNLPGQVVFAVAFASIPVATGIAITRYRLYAIDRLLSRTVSYAVLSVLLVAVYAGGVLGVGALVPSLGSSDLLVAGSTLAVAALFQPLGRRVRSVVDRRFHRARYDAQREVEVLAERLRRHVGLERILDEFADSVDRVVHPSSLSLLVLTSEGDR